MPFINGAFSFIVADLDEKKNQINQINAVFLGFIDLFGIRGESVIYRSDKLSILRIVFNIT